MAQSIYFGGPILTMEEPLYAQALVEEAASSAMWASWSMPWSWQALRPGRWTWRDGA